MKNCILWLTRHQTASKTITVGYIVKDDNNKKNTLRLESVLIVFSIYILLNTITLLELVHASACVYQLLLAGKVRMALVANFNFNYVGILCGTRFESCATSTYNSRFVIIRMYTLFHCRTPLFFVAFAHALLVYYFRGNSSSVFDNLPERYPNRMKSASLPISIVPMRLSNPTSFAGLIVQIDNASTRLRPQNATVFAKPV